MLIYSLYHIKSNILKLYTSQRYIYMLVVYIPLPNQAITPKHKIKIRGTHQNNSISHF